MTIARTTTRWTSLIFMASAALAATAHAQVPVPVPPAPGPAEIVVVVDTDYISMVIEAPLANYGVRPAGPVPAHRHGVPENDDYERVRDAVSNELNADIDDIEPSAGSRIAFNSEAGCRYDEGSESIYVENGQWIVELSLDFDCRQPQNVASVSFNLFDLPGFTEASALVISGDLEAPFDLNATNRRFPLR